RRADRDRGRDRARRPARPRRRPHVPGWLTPPRAAWRAAARASILLRMPNTFFPPIDPDQPDRRDRLDRLRLRRRFRPIPVRTLVPNLIPLLALCAGLTSIRFAIEGKLEIALGAIVLAAVLDGIDGRIARLLKGTSRFGAELDSLADFVNFGVAPGLILYFWCLHELKSLGW